LENPVVTDKVAKDFIEKSNYTFDSIPNNNERIYLRENSNCSTGGECIDMTDIIPKYFKQIAISAAKCFKAKIAGIDIIIDDLNSKEYSIIEVNDNPGYSLNEWPYEGKGERVGLYILKMLGF
jgi:glutamate--cysteine ligase